MAENAGIRTPSRQTWPNIALKVNKVEARAKGLNFTEAQWKPGQSGNPAGRPPGRKTGLRARLLQMLDQKPEADIVQWLESKGIKLEDNDKAEVISLVLGRKAMKGDVQAVKLISEQTEAALPKDFNLRTPDGIQNSHYIIQPVKPLELGDGK